jgi:hypothetical protein
MAARFLYADDTGLLHTRWPPLAFTIIHHTHTYISLTPPPFSRSFWSRLSFSLWSAVIISSILPLPDFFFFFFFVFSLIWFLGVSRLFMKDRAPSSYGGWFKFSTKKNIKRRLVFGFWFLSKIKISDRVILVHQSHLLRVSMHGLDLLSDARNPVRPFWRRCNKKKSEDRGRQSRV